MKTIDEIRAAWEDLIASGINFTLYLGLGDSDHRQYLRADFDDEATEAVGNSFVDSIERYFQGDLSTVALSALDDRANPLVCYDLPDAPAEFEVLTRLTQDPEPATYVFADHDFSEIKTMAVKVSSADTSVVFFKRFYPVSLVKRDQIMLVKGATSRFELVNKDILKVTGGFEVMLMDDEFYINDFSKFEKAFSFDAIAARAMNAVTATIVALNLVHDVKGHLASCEAPRKDIIRAGRSPVLTMPAAAIIAFVSAKQQQLGLQVQNGLVVLNSKESVRRLYRLLNDDYLTSQLTQLEYETLAKNRL
ncbi:anti-phage protein KwaB [Cupriavidus pauculus]|uniref:DUF4868 domain-containing protein n=1 Tax=Cupriavidus pauculus TaxID=82633 RepID=A0A2N5C8L2_9BURK|nr:anti-phage protein KwaB [Cupriavidus pauculus]PLP98554.1 hypothetical protein CYJ10_22020 [Cupriavidus pauculus]